MNDTIIFGLFRRKKREWTGKPAGLNDSEVDEINAVLKAAEDGTGAVSQPKPSDGLASTKGPLVALLGSLAATSLLLTVPKEEGTELAAYRDIAGIVTICNGDTKNVRMGMVETPVGCQRRLEAQLVAHAKPTLACTPRLAETGHDWQRAAAVSLAYNIGVGAWCRSTADKRFDVGDWKGGCDAFLSWSKAKVNGHLRVVQGLLSRRQRERAICLKGLA
jgi:lysozyme